jgi:nucleoside phosphorylase
MKGRSMAPQSPLLFITPTISEYAPVKSALARPLARQTVRLEMCGIGPARAGAFAQRLEQSGPLGGLALIGWAGGLRPDLLAGDVVVAEMALDVQGTSVPCTVVELVGAARGTLLTVHEALMTPAAKYAARASGALAVEMEAVPLAAWAAAHGLPFIHARVILDTLDEGLPDLGGALGPFGRVRPLRLVRGLVLQPRLVIDLWSEARRLQRLRPTLGALAGAILEAWRSGVPA